MAKSNVIRLSRTEQRAMYVELENMKEEQRVNYHSLTETLYAPDEKFDLILGLIDRRAQGSLKVKEATFAYTQFVEALKNNAKESCVAFLSGNLWSFSAILTAINTIPVLEDWQAVSDPLIFEEKETIVHKNNLLLYPSNKYTSVLMLYKGASKANYSLQDFINAPLGEMLTVKKLLSYVVEERESVLDIYPSLKYKTIEAADSYHCNTVSLTTLDTQKEHCRRQLTTLKLR